MAKINSLYITPSFFLILLFHLLTFSDSFVHIYGHGFGINYGQIANNLPSPSKVSILIKSINVKRIKLYDADPNVLTAFSNSDVEFIVGLGNEYLQNISHNPSIAQSWIQQHVEPFLSKTKITCINVGNEVYSTNDSMLISNLLPAMKSVHSALVNLGLDKKITVTTSHSFNILEKSYPPSSGSFRDDLIQIILPLIDFHSHIKSPFLINAYPFFAYKDNPHQIPLNYVLFQPNAGQVDPKTNLHYDNMLYAQIDAVYAAIKALGHTDIEVQISETGWPSKGGPDEIGATQQNAAIYNGNLLKRIEQKQGTPAHPHVPIDVYVFALFNENLKSGPTSERNYGLYYPNGSAVYDIGLQGHLPQKFTPSKANVSSVNFLFYIFIFLMYFGEILEVLGT